MRPVREGGHLHHKGQVEVISSLETDGRLIPYDIRFGVWVVFEGETEYIRHCFTEYWCAQIHRAAMPACTSAGT